MKTKLEATMHIRLPTDVKEALQKAADADRRSLSSLAVKLIAAGLETEGWLKPITKKR